MPRIQEYGAPEVESQVPLEVSSRPIEEAGQMGRALQGFGQQFTNAAEAAYQRQAQEEMSNAHVDGAITRANALASLNKQVANGDVDTEQIMQDFDDHSQEQGDKYGTAHGKQTYDRQMALTRSMLLRQAVTAKAHLVGQQAVQKSQTSLDADSNAVFSDPSAFPSIYKAHMEGLDAQTGEGGIPAGVSEKLKTEHSKNLAVAAVRGWMEINPEMAKKLLTGEGTPDKAGAWDNYFDANTKHQMLGEIETKERHNDAQEGLNERLDARREKAQQESFYRSNFDKMHDGSMRISDVETAVRQKQISPQFGEHLVGMMDKVDRKETQTDWGLKNEWQQRIAENQVSDPQDYRKFYGNGLTKNDIQEFDYMFNSSDEGKQMNENRKTLFKMAESIRFKDPITNQGYAPYGEQKFGKFKSDLIKAEIEQRKQKKPIADLYNPESPDYFGNRINSYSTPLAERYTQSADLMKQQAVTKDNKPKIPLDDFMKGKTK